MTGFQGHLTDQIVVDFVDENGTKFSSCDYGQELTNPKVTFSMTLFNYTTFISGTVPH